MSLFPLFADLRARPVLVVGGGDVATRKAEALLRAGASVRIGAPELSPTIQGWLSAQRVRHLPGVFAPDWLSGVWLVIAATNDREVNRAVAQAAMARRIFVNVVDDPELSQFQVPSVVDRAPLTIAISTAGAAPMFARRVRERLESLFDASLGELTALAARYRQDIQQAFPDLADRRAFYEQLFDGEVALQLRQGRASAAEALLRTQLARPGAQRAGRLIAVGVGPGDPGSLTLAGLRALNLADLLLIHPEVPQGIIDLARKDAQRERVSDAALLMAHAQEPLRAGGCVVWLTPGPGQDPATLRWPAGVLLERIVGVGSVGTTGGSGPPKP